MLGIVRLKKQTDGTRRRTLGADPDVESGFKELIMLKGLYHTFENALRNRWCIRLVYRGRYNFLSLSIVRLTVFCKAAS